MKIKQAFNRWENDVWAGIPFVPDPTKAVISKVRLGANGNIEIEIEQDGKTGWHSEQVDPSIRDKVLAALESEKGKTLAEVGKIEITV